jgi:hypothetical protein
MSRKSKRNHEGGMVAKGAQAARQTAAQVKPLARSTGAATTRGVHKTRAWAAPQVERAGQVVQERVAPRISAWLSSAARRLEPARPRSGRWRKLVGGSALTAAAGAVAAFVRSRMKPDAATPAAETDAADVTPDARTDNGQARASTDGKAKQQPTHTS